MIGKWYMLASSSVVQNYLSRIVEIPENENCISSDSSFRPRPRLSRMNWDPEIRIALKEFSISLSVIFCFIQCRSGWDYPDIGHESDLRGFFGNCLYDFFLLRRLVLPVFLPVFFLSVVFESVPDAIFAKLPYHLNRWRSLLSGEAFCLFAFLWRARRFHDAIGCQWVFMTIWIAAPLPIGILLSAFRYAWYRVSLELFICFKRECRYFFQLKITSCGFSRSGMNEL